MCHNQKKVPKSWRRPDRLLNWEITMEMVSRIHFQKSVFKFAQIQNWAVKKKAAVTIDAL